MESTFTKDGTLAVLYGNFLLAFASTVILGFGLCRYPYFCSFSDIYVL
jgi:hypothetical protein